MKWLVFCLLLGSFQSMAQTELGKHRIELNVHHGGNGPMIDRLATHMKKNGWGATEYWPGNWILGTEPDSALFPKKDVRFRYGFSAYYGYEVKEKIFSGITGGYTYLGSITGRTIDSNEIKIAMDQWFIIPTIRYQPVSFLDITGGIGVAGNRSTLRNTDLPVSTYTSITVSYSLCTEFILRPENFFSYWKFGLGYQHTHPTKFGPYRIDYNTNFPEYRFGYNYLTIRVTLIGVSL